VSEPQAVRRPSAPPGGKPAYILGADCQRCVRFDFPLMLVVGSAVDKAQDNALQQAGYRYAATLDPAFAAIARKATVPFTRLLSSGFVYVFYEKRGVWDIWQSFDDGTLKKLLEHCNPQEYAAKQNGVKPEQGGSMCQRGAANLAAGLITVIGVSTQPTVWLGFSRHLWTPQVLSDMTADKHGARAKLMRKLAAQAWFNGGGNPGEGFLPLNEANLATHVPEFHPEVPPGGAQFNPLVKACADSTTGMGTARLGQAAAMAARVRLVEKTAGPKAENKALIACLPDPIGQTAEHNQLRNAQMERFVLFKQKHEREHAIAELVGVFKESVEAHAHKDAGQHFDDTETRRAEFNREHPPRPRVTYGADGKVHVAPPPPPEAPAAQRKAQYEQHMQRWAWSRYSSYLNPGWEAFEAQYKHDHDTQANRVAALAEDHLQALHRPEIGLAMQHLFDPCSRDDGPAYEAAMALMVHGMGATPTGDAWLAEQLSKKPDDHAALVWRSLFGNQHDVIAHVMAATASPKWDKVYSAMKKALTWPERGKDTPSARMAGGWERVLVTVSGPLSKLLADDKSSIVLHRVWEGLAWSRAGVAVVHQQFMLQSGLRSLAHFFEYAAWYTVDLTLGLDGQNPFTKNLSATMPVPGRGNVVAATLPKPTDPKKTLVHMVMVPEAIEDAQSLINRASQLREVTVKEAAESFAKVKRAVNFDAKLGCVALVFELVNYFKAEGAIAKADQFKEAEAKGALRAAILGGLNAVADINAAWVKGVYEPQWKQSLALGSRKVYGGLKVAGGLFGGVASFIGAYWAFSHGREKNASGETAMEWLYYSAATAGLVSGVSTIVNGGAAGLEAFGRMQTATATMTRARAAFWGIRAGLIGVAVSLVILAYEDEPIAKWLERTVWGKRPKDQQYANLKEELRELDKLVKVTRHD
jgi:hypothetical protein